MDDIDHILKEYVYIYKERTNKFGKKCLRPQIIHDLYSKILHSTYYHGKSRTNIEYAKHYIYLKIFLMV